MKRVVDVEVDPEDRIGLEGIEVHDRSRGILVSVHSDGFFNQRGSLLLICDAVEVDGKGKKGAVVLQDLIGSALFEKLIVLFIDEEGDL